MTQRMLGLTRGAAGSGVDGGAYTQPTTGRYPVSQRGRGGVSPTWRRDVVADRSDTWTVTLKR